MPIKTYNMNIVIDNSNSKAYAVKDLLSLAQIVGTHVNTVRNHLKDKLWNVKNFTVYFEVEDYSKSGRGGIRYRKRDFD